jgi:hypothetical protein
VSLVAGDNSVFVVFVVTLILQGYPRSFHNYCAITKQQYIIFGNGWLSSYNKKESFNTFNASIIYLTWIACVFNDHLWHTLKFQRNYCKQEINKHVICHCSPMFQQY